MLVDRHISVVLYFIYFRRYCATLTPKYRHADVAPTTCCTFASQSGNVTSDELLCDAVHLCVSCILSLVCHLDTIRKVVRPRVSTDVFVLWFAATQRVRCRRSSWHMSSDQSTILMQRPFSVLLVKYFRSYAALFQIMRCTILDHTLLILQS